MRINCRLCSLFATALLMAPSMLLTASETALVEKKTNLRRDPSAQHTPIRVLLPDEEVVVLDSTTSTRYLKVKPAG